MRSAILLVCLAIASQLHADLPSNPLPDGIGVNIHFTDPRPGEMEMLAAAGVKWVRMDLGWSGIERNKGVYDFAAYDRLVAALEKHGMHAIFILDYSNRMYDEGLSPHTEEGRVGFAKWATATAKHFAGRGMIWEMWNEPNGGFWKPRANVEDYAQLALAVGKALREAAPKEMYIGPATSEIDLKFIEACFKAGCLEYWSAVSVHPYRQSMPESAAGEYRALRQLIFKYAPKGKKVPIISGEWGYSAVWNNFDEEKQGKYLVRQLLTNQWQEIPISIWYDWHDDGTDPKEGEHHFGTVHKEYRKDQSPVYEPKPAYIAMKTMAEQLRGYKFNKRLVLEKPEDYALLFMKGDDVKLVAWTTGEAHDAALPASAGAFRMWVGMARPAGAANATATGLNMHLADAPQYLHPDQSNDLLRCASACESAPLEAFVHWPEKMADGSVCHNPLSRPIVAKWNGGSAETIEASASPPAKQVTNGAGALREVSYIRSAVPVINRSDWEFVGLGHIVQETQIIVTNPLTITVLPRAGDVLPVRIADPDKAGFKANVTLVGIEGLEVESATVPVELKPGESEATVHIKAKPDGNDYSVGVQITDDQGKAIAELPQANYGGVADFSAAITDGKITGYSLASDGDAKIASEQSLSLDSLPPPEPGMRVVKLTYKVPAGWKFWQLKPATEELKTIKGKPKALCLWIAGDGAGGSPRVRFIDSTGQTFQAAGEKITWKGWRYITIPMDTAAVAGSHWGGKNDGVIHYPIHWDTLLLLDHDKEKAIDGAISIAGPMLVRAGTAQ